MFSQALSPVGHLHLLPPGVEGPEQLGQHGLTHDAVKLESPGQVRVHIDVSVTQRLARSRGHIVVIGAGLPDCDLTPAILKQREVMLASRNGPSHLNIDTLILLPAENVSVHWIVDVERDVTFRQKFWSKFENYLPILLDLVQPCLLKPSPVQCQTSHLRHFH